MKTLARPGDRAEILRRLKQVRPESPARWGRMSAHQMVCHVGDCNRMATGERLVRLPTGRLRRPAIQRLIRWYGLYLPIPWPRGIRTRAELDQERLGTRPGDFAQDLACAVQSVEVLATRPDDFVWPVHPLFGVMSGADWLRWGYLHTDHHLRQFGA